MELKNKRGQLLVNRNFQLSIIFWIFLLGLMIEIIFYTANLYFFTKLHNEATSAGLAPDNIFFQYLEAQKLFMNKVFLISTLLSALIISWGGLYLSHKIAGPLYKLTKHLRSSSLSTIEPVHFRKGDYFPEIQDAFNELIKKK